MTSAPTSPADIIILPGIGGSGPQHWQSRWQEQQPSMRRFRPDSWDQPELESWLSALDREIAASKRPPLLVAHSLGALLVAHWAKHAIAPVAGAFLVAIPDPDSPVFPREAPTFHHPPTAVLPFPSLIVASTDDPYGSTDYAHSCGRQWGARVVVAGALGHINVASGIGDWPWGKALFRDFAGSHADTISAEGF